MKNKEYRLPKEFATRWLKALRSGDYKQCHQQLYTEDGYCCLGVACNIVGHQKTLTTAYEKELPRRRYFIDDPYYINVPKELKGDSDENELVKILSGMNDDDKVSFEIIADWIEENVELY